MQKSSILGAAVAIGLLSSVSANAVMTLPSNTTTGSSLFVTVFDPTTSEAYVTDLVKFYSDFMTLSAVNSTPNAIRPQAFTPLSYQLDMSIFADNTASNLLFSVHAADTAGGNGAKGFISTMQADPTGLINNEMVGAGTLATQLLTYVNQNCPATAGCAAPGYGADILWGNTINGNVDVGTGAAIGEAIAFYSVTGANTPSSSGVTTFTQFIDNLGQAWVWNLDGDGTLTFSAQAGAPVPLPAAVWLLLSGLAGAGALGRRSRQSA